MAATLLYEVWSNQGQLVVGDPDPSKKVNTMPLEEFAKEWTGVTLFVPGETPLNTKKMYPDFSFYQFCFLVVRVCCSYCLIKLMTLLILLVLIICKLLSTVDSSGAHIIFDQIARLMHLSSCSTSFYFSKIIFCIDWVSPVHCCHPLHQACPFPAHSFFSPRRNW